MSQPCCHICGHELGLSPASRCVHQPLTIAPTPLTPEEQPDLLELLLTELDDEQGAMEEVDPAFLDCIVTGSVGGVPLPPTDDPV